jgi:tRNA-Thr(GGU) m(6)t(6)A37 methyltransferase TsaA
MSVKEFKPIGKASTCFKEKFCIPRQSGLAPHSKGVIKLFPPFNREEALRGLDSFDTLIITFIPHQAKQSDKNHLSVRPPRLGGNKKIGVFATRSPFRPNPICTSIVSLDQVDLIRGEIHFSNHDLLDETPILDIRPYIPMWDSYPKASAGWTQHHPDNHRLEVIFKRDLLLEQSLKKLITEVLSLDPRPRYQENRSSYAFKLENYDIHFHYLSNKIIEVTKVELLT